MIKKKKVFITGVAGFIGYHLSQYFLKNNYSVFGIDNMNNYYSVNLKKKRLSYLKKNKQFIFKKIDLDNKIKLKKYLKNYNPQLVINLAAQPGVRYSYERPDLYIRSNLKGLINLLEIMYELKLNKFIYASSSSVYGDAKKFPTKEIHELNPINLYGETKVLNEKIVELYCKYLGVDSFGLRFFTAYGSLGRPDMMISKTINNIINDKKISLYNNGNHTRDYTHVSDIVKSIFILSKKIKKFKGHEIFNISSNKKITLKNVINSLEKLLKKKSKVVMMKKQKGDMLNTLGYNQKIVKFTKYKISTNFYGGLKEIIDNDT